MFDNLLADLRFSLRMLRKNPGFTAIVVATLALGIGANTAIFSVVDAVVLRPLSYRQPDRLFVIHESVPKFAHLAPLLPVNAMHFREWRKNARSFDEMALLGGMTLNLTGTGEPERLAAARVSSNLFSMLGIQPRLGRTFLAEEDQPGRDRVVILDDGLWKRRFSSDPNIVGRKILLNGQPYQVIGVLPQDFHFPKLSQLFAMRVSEERPQLWKPFALRDDELDPLGDFNYACIALLRNGVSPAQALSELNLLQGQIARQVPEKIELRAALVPMQAQIAGSSRLGLELMLCAVAIVLLTGCVNIANLLLARASDRHREIAIRSAIGAGRRRLLQQALVESLLLSCAGGLLGILVAGASIRLLLAHAPMDLPRLDEVRLDTGILLFTLCVSLLTGLLFGLMPAWRFARADPQDAMKSGTRGTTSGRSGSYLRLILVGFEVALSALCLVAGGLLLHSFVNLLNVNGGFDAQHVLTLRLALPANRYPSHDKRVVFLRSLLQGVEALPGVTAVGLSNMLPLGGEGGNNLLQLEGRNLPLLERPLADIRQVNPDYFRAMGVPLRSGRFFTEADRDRKIALVSELTAHRLWPGLDPLGRRFRIGGDHSPLLEIAGIVGDVRGVSLNKPPSFTVYIPYWQQSNSQVSLAVKTRMSSSSAEPEIRAAIRRLDPELPVPAFETMQEVVAGSVSQRRFQMNLVLLFGLAAALLASLGIYGVISYSVVQRTNEVGIRLALGALPSNIRALIFRQSLVPVAIGLFAGLSASFVLNRLLGSLLFSVKSGDPFTLLGVAAMIALVAAIATYVPARRATRVDPLIALRYE